MALDCLQCAVVESVPSKLGTWAFRGTRMPVAAFCGRPGGLGIDQILTLYYGLIHCQRSPRTSHYSPPRASP